MKNYKYIISKKDKTQDEFWVCENCRRLYNNLILESKWRLIDRDDGVHACSKCSAPETEL